MAKKKTKPLWTDSQKKRVVDRSERSRPRNLGYRVKQAIEWLTNEYEFKRSGFAGSPRAAARRFCKDAAIEIASIRLEFPDDALPPPPNIVAEQDVSVTLNRLLVWCD